MEKASLSELVNGAVIEAFDHELGQVAANIMDPNTVATARQVFRGGKADRT